MIKLLIRLARFLQFHNSFFWVLIIFSIVSSSCNKFDGDVTVPAFLQIDTVFFATDVALQGENSHEISDVWVYVDDQQMGVFELPAKFPLLFNGKHRLEIRPGIKLNGISSTRSPYPLMKPIVIDDFEFFPDSVQKLNSLTFKYYSNVTFAWIESFENNNLTIQETQSSDTVIKLTSPANNPEAYLSSTSSYSGQINLTAEKPYYNAWSFYSYALPGLESPVLLEMDFKTDNYVTVGLFVHTEGGYKPVPLVVLNHSDEWNHIYINFTPTVGLNPFAIDFKVFFEAGLENGKAKSNIYFDNVKLIYRDNN